LQSATFVPFWKPTTAYALGAKVLSPGGDTVTAKVAFTSGATFNQNNWNLPAATLKRAANASKNAKGAIVLIFDDLYPDHYNVVAPLVESYGGHITLAATQDYTNGSAGGGRYMSYAMLTDLVARGHEIACHSKTHTDMTTQTATQRLAEWDDARSFFEGITGVPITSFAFPYSANNLAIDIESYLRYDRTFAGSLMPYVEQRDRRTLGITHGRFNWRSLYGNHQMALDLVWLAATQNVVVNIFTHTVDGSDLTYGVTSAELQELVNLAGSLGVPMLTAAEAYPAHVPVPDGGFEDAAVTNWIQTKAGASTITVVADAPVVGFAGTKSLCIVGDGTGYSSVLSRSQVAINEAGEHTLSIRIRQEKTSGTGGGYIQVQEFDAYGVQVASAASTPLAAGGSTPWTQAKVVFTPNVATRGVKFLVAQGPLVGTTYFDHLHFGPTRYGVLG